MTFTPNPDFFDNPNQNQNDNNDFFSNENQNSMSPDFNFDFQSHFSIDSDYMANDDSFLYPNASIENDLIFPPIQFQHRRTYTAPVSVNPQLPPTPAALNISSHQSNSQFQPRPYRKPVPPIITCPEDLQFYTLCQDASVRINPHKIGFIPEAFWPDAEFSFGDFVYDFFQRKNNVNSRFPHKLFNALCISINVPMLKPFMGVKWVSDTTLQVDKREFARLLGIKSIDGSLFHQQGNFPTHGFVELTLEEIRTNLGENILQSFNAENTKFLQHQYGAFVRSSTQAEIEQCKWVSARIRKLDLTRQTSS